jgi:hypothetical protein
MLKSIPGDTVHVIDEKINQSAIFQIFFSDPKANSRPLS